MDPSHHGLPQPRTAAHTSQTDAFGLDALLMPRCGSHQSLILHRHESNQKESFMCLAHWFNPDQPRHCHVVWQESETWDRHRVQEVQYNAQMHANMWHKLEVPSRPPSPRTQRLPLTPPGHCSQELRSERDTLLRRVHGLEVELEVRAASRIPCETM